MLIIGKILGILVALVIIGVFYVMDKPLHINKGRLDTISPHLEKGDSLVGTDADGDREAARAAALQYIYEKFEGAGAGFRMVSHDIEEDSSQNRAVDGMVFSLPEEDACE